MIRFYVEISEEAVERLREYAHERRRRPVDQAAVLLEQALGVRALENPQVGEVTVNGRPIADLELERQVP